MQNVRLNKNIAVLTFSSPKYTNIATEKNYHKEMVAKILSVMLSVSVFTVKTKKQLRKYQNQ